MAYNSNDPFKEFGGKSVQPSNDPFAEFGGKSVDAKKKSTAAEAASPTPTGGVSGTGLEPSQPKVGGKVEIFPTKDFSGRTAKQKSFTTTYKKDTSLTSIVGPKAMLDKNDVDYVATKAFEDAKTKYGSSFEKNFYDPKGNVNKQFAKSYLDNYLGYVGYKGTKTNLNDSDIKSIEARFDTLATGTLTPSKMDNFSRNISKAMVNVQKKAALEQATTPEQKKKAEDLYSIYTPKPVPQIEPKGEAVKAKDMYASTRNVLTEDVMNMMDEPMIQAVNSYLLNNEGEYRKYVDFGTGQTLESQMELISKAMKPKFDEAVGQLSYYSNNGSLKALEEMAKISTKLNVYNAQMQILKKQIDAYSPADMSPDQKRQFDVDKGNFQVKETEYKDITSKIINLEQALKPVFEQLDQLRPYAQAGGQEAITKYNALYDANKDQIDAYKALSPELKRIQDERNVAAQVVNKYSSSQKDVTAYNSYKQAIDKYNKLYDEALPFINRQKEISAILPEEDINKMVELISTADKIVNFGKQSQEMLAVENINMLDYMPMDPVSDFMIKNVITPAAEMFSEYTLKATSGVMRGTSDFMEFITMKPEDYYSTTDYLADVVSKGFDLSGEVWTNNILPGYRRDDFIDPTTGDFIWTPQSVVVGTSEQFGQIAAAAFSTNLLMGAGMGFNSAVVAPMFFATYDDNKELAKKLGFQGSSATTAGVLFSLIEGTSELIFPDIQLFQGGAKMKLFETFLENYSKGGKSVAIKSVLEAIAKENGEELSVEVGKYLTTLMTRMVGGENEQYTTSGSDLLQTFVFTTLSAGAPASVQAMATASKNFNYAAKFEMAKDLENSIAMIDNYNNLGKIDDTKANNLKRDLSVISAVQGQLPSDISNAKRVVISNIYAQRAAIDEKINDSNISPEVKAGYEKIRKTYDADIANVMLADDAGFNKAYNEDTRTQTEQVVNEFNKETGFGQPAETTQQDELRTQILTDIFGDTKAQRDADAMEQRMNNAEEVSVDEINSVLEGLYAQVETIMDNYFDNEAGKQYAQALLDKIDKIRNYELATGTKTDVVTERQTIQTARAAVGKEASVINFAKGPKSKATITSEDGTTGEYSIEVSGDGNVTFEQKGAEPIQVGNASDVNKSASIVDAQFNNNGLPTSVTFAVKGQDGKTYTINVVAKGSIKPDQLLDLAIGIRANEVGTVDPTAFDEAFNEVTRETTTKTYPNAVQVETAGQVPVQPEARVGEQVEEGKPQAESQETAQEGQEVNDAIYNNIDAAIEYAWQRAGVPEAVNNVISLFTNSGLQVRVIEDVNEYNSIVPGGEGTQGMFRSEEGIIYLNPSLFESGFGRTVVYHEGIHPIINIIRNTDPKLYNAVRDGLIKLSETNKGVKDAFTWVEKNTQSSDPLTIEDEKIVETLARIADGSISLNTIPQTLLDRIVEFFNTISLSMGLGRPFRQGDLKSAASIARQITKALQTGKGLEGIVGKGNIGKYQWDLNQARSIAEEVQSKVVPGKTVGTRNPTAKGATEKGVNEKSLADLNELMRNEKAFKFNAIIIAQYDIMSNSVPQKLLTRLENARKPLDRIEEKIEKIVSDINTIKDDISEKIKANIKKEMDKLPKKERGRMPNKAQLEKMVAAIIESTDPAVGMKSYKDRIESKTRVLENLREDKDAITKEYKKNVSSISASISMDEAKAIYNGLVNLTEKNLELLIDTFPENLRDIAKLWYDGANIIAQEFADKYGISLEQSAAVLAVFSPQKDWFMNISLAERAMNVYMNMRDYEFDANMAERFIMRSGLPQIKTDKEGNEIFDEKTGQYVYEGGAQPLIVDGEHVEINGVPQFTGWSNQKKEQNIKDAEKLLDQMRGKKLKDLPLRQQAIFIRMHSEVYDNSNFNVYTPDGQVGELYKTEKGTIRNIAWGGYNTIEKAINIMNANESDMMNIISDALGKQHKVRSFYNNIVDPANKSGHVTMDTHAIAAVLMKPLSGSSLEVTQNFGGGGTSSDATIGINGLYPVFAEAYKRTAEKLGYLPREIQSITWEAVRMLFKAKWKSNKRNVGEVNSKWREYKNKTKTLDQVINEIFEFAAKKSVEQAKTDGIGVGITDWGEVIIGRDNPEYAGKTYDKVQLSPSGGVYHGRAGRAGEPGAAVGASRMVPESSRRGGARDLGVKGQASKAAPRGEAGPVVWSEKIDEIQSLPISDEGGSTLNVDGTEYTGGGLIVPIDSVNLTQGTLTKEAVLDFIEKNKEKIGSESVKVGFYKFENDDKVSIDLNLVVPAEYTDVALEFGRLAGQESLFNLDTFKNIKTGSDGKNPKSFTAQEFNEISKSLAEGKMPNVAGITQFSQAAPRSKAPFVGVPTVEAAGLTTTKITDWRKKNKISQREGRVSPVQQSAQDLADGKKTIYEHIETVRKEQPTTLAKSVPKMPPIQDVVSALADNQVKTGVVGLNIEIPEGSKVGLRLDIPSLNNYGVRVMSVHEGAGAGTSVGYGRAGSISNVTFKTSPSQALSVATGSAKGTFARMVGTWNNESEESVYERAKKAINDPSYIQIGMNPFRHSWFYDKATGMPIMEASEVLQVGDLVLAKDARVLDLTNAKDKAEFEDKFKVKLKSGKMSQFSKAAPRGVDDVAKALEDVDVKQFENIKYGKTKEGLTITQTKEGPFVSDSGNAQYGGVDGIREEKVQGGVSNITIKNVWNKFVNIKFNGSLKVSNASDVAHIMRQLENKAVEHAFVVHVNKSGKTYIQYLGAGGVAGAVVDPALVLAGVKRYNSNQVYLVHNHPSGKMVPSQSDIVLTQNIRDLLGPLNIKVEHVILDTYKKEYVHIDTSNYPSVQKRDISKENNEKYLKSLKAEVMDEFELLTLPFGNIKSSKDAAQFFTQIRFTALPKNGMLVLNRANDVIGNYILPNDFNYEDVTTNLVGAGIGQAVIFYSNQDNYNQIRDIKSNIEKAGIGVLDYIRVDSDSKSVSDYYKSYADKGLLSESQEKYGTNSISKEEQDITPQSIAEAYVQAKQNGSNPELVKAVEDVIVTTEDSGMQMPEGTKERIDKLVNDSGMRGQASPWAARGLMNVGAAARLQYPMHQQMVTDAMAAYDLGARNYVQFANLIGQEPNVNIEAAWDDAVRIKRGEEPIIKTQNDYEKWLTRLNRSELFTADRIKKMLRSSISKLSEATFDSKNEFFKALAEQTGEVWGVVAAYTHVIGGQAAKADYMAEMFMEGTFNNLGEKQEYKIEDQMYSELELFKLMLIRFRVLEIQRKMQDKFNEFKGLDDQINNKNIEIGILKQMQSALKSKMNEDLKTLRPALDYKGRLDMINKLIEGKVTINELNKEVSEYNVNSNEIAIRESEIEVLKVPRGYVKEYLDRNNMLKQTPQGWVIGKYKYTGGIDPATADGQLRNIQNKYPELYKKLKGRSDAYMQAFNTLLGMQLDNGLISQGSYDELTKYGYVPMQNVAYMLEEVIQGDELNIGNKNNELVKRLKGGSEEDVNMSFDEILKFATYMTHRRIAQNNAAKELYNAAKDNVDNTAFYIPQAYEFDRYGNATAWYYDDKKEGLIYAFIDGQRVAIAADAYVAKAYSGTNKIFGNAPAWLGWAFMTTPFRAITTNLNPGFGIAQVVIDLPQAIMATDAYASVLYGAPAILFRDLKLISGKVLNKIAKKIGLPGNMTTEFDQLYEEAVSYGALISFTKGADVKEAFKEKSAFIKAIDKSGIGKGIAAYTEKVESVNTVMETVTRLAVYRKKRNTLINKYKKNNGGAMPTGKDMDDIKTQAAATSLNMLNYNRGGTVVKPLNNALAYLNVAFQVFYSNVENFKKNKWNYTFKATELVGYGTLAMVLGYLLLDDDEEKRKFEEKYNSLSDFEKYSYWHIVNPFRDPENEDTYFWRFKKVGILQPMINSAEVYAMHHVTGGRTTKPEDYLKDRLKDDLAAAQPFQVGLASSVPALNAYLMLNNYDAYRKQPVVRGEEVTLDYREGMSDPRVGKFYKYIAKLGVVDPYTDEGLLSPARTDAAIKALVGNYENNITTSLPLYTLDAAFMAASGDYKALEKQLPDAEQKDFLTKVWEGTGLPKRFLTNIPDVNPKYYDLKNDVLKRKNALNESLKLDVDQIISENASTEKRIEMVRNYWKLNVKYNKLYTLEDYERSLENAIEYVQNNKWLEDKPKWYKGFIMTPDKELKALMYDIETENLNFDETLKQVAPLFQKGLISEELDEYIAKDLASKKMKK